MLLIRRTKQFIATIREAFATYVFLRQLLREGCLTVETHFYYSEKKYHFTTKVQLDADIINYIPPFELLHDKEFLEKYQHYFKKHQHRVANKVWAISKANDIVDEIVGVFVLFFINSIAFYLELIQSIEQRGWITTLSIIVSFLFWKYFRKYLASLIFRLIYLNLRWRLNLKKKRFVLYWN